ncbi:MAG: murein L,D-transpeptidase [Cytophagaceae bacterium]|nr:MAG: murein L,D-transpeptidase [Cytophagaceae bacterium]
MIKAVLITLVVAATMGGALAQTPNTNAPTSASPNKSPESRSSAALALSPNPVLDEATAARITATIDLFRQVVSRGGWPSIPQNTTADIKTPPNDHLVRQRLIASNDLTENDNDLSRAIKAFQARHGIPETGTVGPRTLAALNVPAEKRLKQLEASLKRIETLGFNFAPRYVVVNIPAAFVEAIENGKVVRRYRVIVGKSEKPSPTVTSQITSVNLNPNWTVPASITKGEIAAHMRKDATYLERMHMQVFDAKNQLVQPSSIDWTNTKALNIVVRQLPGEWNALGRVKIDMPNPFAVYMHDTNQKNLFSNDYRFDSHGCARVDNVRDLAAWLLDDVPYWERSQIDEVIASGDRVDVKLTQKMPVAWVYLTAWVTGDGKIQFRDDVYDQDAQLTAASLEETEFFKRAADRPSTSATR